MRVWVSRGFGRGRRPASPRSGPGCLALCIGGALALVALAVAWIALAVAAIVLVPLSLFLVARTLREPETVSRITGSRLWGRLPGMRSATGAGAVAALLLLYGTVIPGASFAGLVVAGSKGSPPTQASPGSSSTATTTPDSALEQSDQAIPVPTPAPTQAPTPTPTLAPTPEPTPVPVPPTPAPTAPPPTARPTPAPTAPPPPPPPTQAANLCGAPSNPYGYNFCGGSYLYNPAADICSYIDCIASFWTSTNGYVDQCVDGTFSHSGGRSGACSHHGGESRPLYG